MTVAEYIAERLFSEGVRYVFGVPGGASIPLIEAIRQAGIAFVLTAEERSAGFMADVTARITGIPGVCHSTFGPGATNMSTGVGCALLDRSPLLALTSEMPDDWIDRTTQMNINHQALFKPVTKATFRLSPRNVQSVLPRALSICNEEYPGPVHLGIPSDIAGNQVSSDVKSQEVRRQQIPENNHDITEIKNLLKSSKNPVIAIGLTAARLCNSRQVNTLLTGFQVPVLLTPMAKGLIDEEHPCYAGVLSHALSDYLEDIISQADLVIGLGYDPVEYNYESWMPDVPLIHFDTVLQDLPRSRDVYSFVGDPTDWFAILSELKLTSGIISSGLLAEVREEMDSVFRGFTSGFGPVTVIKVLGEMLPRDTIATVDVGSHLHLAGQYWKTHGSRNLIMTNGWSSMGFGLPAAIAAKLNKPSSTVVCLTGDGGFLMSAGEVLTARRCLAPIIIVVFSDGELNLIKLKQTWKGLQPYGIHISSGDLFGSEYFLGAKVFNATSETTLRDAVMNALILDETVIINAIIDPEDYKWLVVKQK